MLKSQNSVKSRKKLSKSGNLIIFDVMEIGPKFLTTNAKRAFNRLRLAFTKASILWHFDLKCHIWIETDASGYAISGMLNKLTLGTNPNEIITKANLNQWYLVAFFLKKIIPAKTWYKIHNSKLLTIIKAFKI